MKLTSSFKPILAILIAAMGTSSASAAQNGRKAYEEAMQDLRSQISFAFNEECEQVLQQPWGQFSGDSSEYRSLEAKYLNGASLAAVCAIKYGYIRYLWLGDLETVRADPAFARKPLAVQTKEATRINTRRKVRDFDDFLAKVNCNASTPRISLRGYFNQRVNVECSTPLGPASINPSTLHVQIAGKDMWNGANDTHFGRNFFKITGTRP